MSQPAIGNLRTFLNKHENIFVLTGAGLSLASGIPTYRDHRGIWQRSDPIQHQQFMTRLASRQRYWARSAIGWPTVASAQPNASHQTLQKIEKDSGKISLVLTQNVDGLHQKAGSKNVCDLHGRIDRVICMDCGIRSHRGKLQDQLLQDNPWIDQQSATPAPDGDADFEDQLISKVKIPTCTSCGGLLKPDVVFFGDNVPRQRVEHAMLQLENSDALWVIGSSLMVYSGLRFVRKAKAMGLPICILNLGHTRADELADLKITQDCQSALELLYQQIF